MSVPIDEILRTLRLFPNGATTKQLAERMGAKHSTIGSRLSKQWVQGRGTVDRVEQTVKDSRGRHDEYVYRIKERA